MLFKLSYTFLGGLGIFFFGMKTLSDSLQAMAGGFIRKVINTLTTNRISAVLVGTFVTTLVQSSSVTTVMVVGLVNAGLMELTQAIGVIFGANVGTTITGWIIAIKVGKYGLLMVGLGVFPMLFAQREAVKQMGRVLVAIGFIFLGLEYMSSAFKPLRNNETFLELMQYFTADTYLSLLACIGMGAGLTFIIQSSSAMLGITIALALTGAITYPTAVGLVLGENIGTTITALLASVGANSQGKRAARAHAAFNVMGVLWVSPLFWIFLRTVDWVIPGVPDEIGADGGKPFIAAHIAAAHTMFNVTNTIAFIPFMGRLARFVEWITPAPKMKEKPHLKYLYTTAETAPGLALATAEKELHHLAEVVSRTYQLSREYVMASKTDRKVFDKLTHLEEVCDAIQGEVTLYICRIQESPLSAEQSALAYALIRAADELESISDYAFSMARYRNRMDAGDAKLSSEAKKDLDGLFVKVGQNFESLRKSLRDDRQFDLRKVYGSSRELARFADNVRDRHRARMEKRQCTPEAGMIFSDIVVALRKIKSHVVNLAEALAYSGVEET